MTSKLYGPNVHGNILVLLVYLIQKPKNITYLVVYQNNKKTNRHFDKLTFRYVKLTTDSGKTYRGEFHFT